MILTKIYGLFDPRYPDVIMYVGKGAARRAQHHWKRFLAKGTAVNAFLRRWFERLRADDVEPAWRFLEENVFDWPARERDLIGTWRVMNPNLCNIPDGGDGPHGSDVARKMGKLNGGIAFRRAWKLHPEKMREAAKKAGIIGSLLGSSKGGKVGGGIAFQRAWKLYPEKMYENVKKGAPLGGRIGNHSRWHVKRDRPNPLCQLCRPEFFDLWEGGAQF